MKSFRTYNHLFCFIIMMVVVARVSAQQYHEWIRTNPGGGGAFNVIGAGINGNIFVGSDLSGAYRSINNGLSWEVIGAEQGLTETHVSGIGFHRTIPEIVFIGTENGLFRSADTGDNFTKVLEAGYITDIEFGYAQPQIGYLSYHPSFDSAQGSIYKSEDNGITWNPVSVNLPSGLYILKLLVHPENADIIYLLSGKGRFVCGPAEVYKSTDGGMHWFLISTDLSPVLDIAMDPVHPDILYLTDMNAECGSPYYWTDLEGSIYKSTNGGITWNYLSSHTGVIWLNSQDENVIRLIDPREPYSWNPLSGTYTSFDGGYNFIQTGNVQDWDTFYNEEPYWCYGVGFNGISTSLGVDLSDENSYYWVNTQWVFKTENSGNIFENIFTDEISPGYWQSRGIDNVNMMDLAVHRTHPEIIFAAYFDMGLWRSVDAGLSWQSCNPVDYTGSWEGHGGNCSTVIMDPLLSNVVWASLSENQNGEPPVYLIKSINTGQPGSWMFAGDGLPQNEIMGLAIDANSPVGNRTLYVTADKDVYKSTDDGEHWSLVLDCNGCRFTAIDASNMGVYAGGENGLWRSLDGGENWQNISHPDMIDMESGDFWDDNYQGIFDVYADPVISNRLYVVVLGQGKGLYRSDDAGNTWTKILTDDFLRKIAVVPANPQLIYVTSSSAFQAGGYQEASQGILFSYDGGNSWHQQNAGMAYPFALSVAIDFTPSPDVIVGVPGTGFQKSTVPMMLNSSDISVSKTNPVIYPSPCDDLLYLSGIVDAQPKFIDVLGRDWTALTHSVEANAIDVSALPSGFYLVVAKNARMRFYKR